MEIDGVYYGTMLERLSSGETSRLIATIEGHSSRQEFLQALARTTPLMPGLTATIPEGSEELGNRVRVARIHTDLHMSLAKRSWSAATVAHHLSHARDGLDAAQTLVSVIDGNPNFTQPRTEAPYAFSAEVTRDKANYCVVLSALTGNTMYLQQAQELLSGIILNEKLPYKERSIVNLARFENAMLKFTNFPSVDTYRELSTYYIETAAAAKNGKNWNRIASVSAQFILASWEIRRMFGIWTGWGNYDDARSMDQNTKGIFIREALHKMSQPIREKIWWRTTPPGEDYNRLRLE